MSQSAAELTKEASLVVLVDSVHGQLTHTTHSTMHERWDPLSPLHSMPPWPVLMMVSEVRGAVRPLGAQCRLPRFSAENAPAASVQSTVLCGRVGFLSQDTHTHHTQGPPRP